MKTKFTLFVFAFAMLSWAGVQGQAMSYFPDMHPSQMITANDGGELQIDATNISTSAVTLTYDLISSTYDPAWQVLFCDNEVCIPNLPQSRNMLPINPNDSMMVFKVTLNPNGVAGTGTATYRVWDSANPSDEDTISVTFFVSEAVGIEDEAIAAQVELFPQPASNELNLRLPAKLGTVEAQVFNLNGALISSEVVSGFANIDLSNLAAGTYVLRLTNDKYVVRKRFNIAK